MIRNRSVSSCRGAFRSRYPAPSTAADPAIELDGDWVFARNMPVPAIYRVPIGV